MQEIKNFIFNYKRLFARMEFENSVRYINLEVGLRF